MLIVFLQVSNFLKFIQVLVISAIKFIFAPPVSIEYGFTWLQTILFTTIGGIIGVIFFYYLSGILLHFFRKVFPYVKQFFKMFKREKINMKISNEIPEISKKKSFTWKNKFIIKTRKKYGLWGIAILTPVLLSIPLGTFLANKYYANKKRVILTLSISVACWSLIVSSIYFLF